MSGANDDLLHDYKDQFRLNLIQLYNWGTFRNLHRIPINRDGHLVVGPSGSGKSTILDAKTALMAPSQWMDFNVAAREGSKRDRDRNLVTYIRGAWSHKESDEGDTKVEVIEKGTTWSALAMTLSTLDGRVVTLAELYWIRGSSMDPADVKRHYLVFDREFDIAELEFFGKEDLNIRKLKQTLKAAYSDDVAAGYRECLMSKLGIPSEQALKLLHKAQSLKNIGDINSFMRELMLEKPGTFEVARKLVEEFTNLNEAYLHVQKARQQIEVLAPAREDAIKRAAALAASGKLRELDLGMEHYIARRRRALLGQAIDDSIETCAQIERNIGAAEQVAREAEARLDELKRALWQAGGETIDRLRGDLTTVADRRARAAAKRSEVEDALRQLGYKLPGDPESYAALVTELVGHTRSIEAEITASDNERLEVAGRRRQIEKDLETTENELRTLAARKSNIRGELQQLRKFIADGVGCSEDDLPFAGELLQVREDEKPWRGAIERLLGKFSTSILVSDALYPKVRRFVNETNLRQNLSYHLAGNSNQARARDGLTARAAFRKLEAAPGPFNGWLQAEIRSRFNHECIDSPEELGRFEYALTREGQVRGGRSLHEKRDRYQVDDEQQWSLGWDNAERRWLYEARRTGLRNQLAEAVHQEQAKANALTSRVRTLQHVAVLKSANWTEIDTQGLDRRKAEIEGEIKRIRSGSKDLEALDKQVDDQRQVLEKRNGEVARERNALRDAQRRREEWRKDLEELEADASYVEPTPAQLSGLDIRFAAVSQVMSRPVSIATISDIGGKVQRALSDELRQVSDEAASLRIKIEKAFTEFKNRWPLEAAEMDTSVESAQAYFGLLETLERDRLPEFERRFKDMLQSQSDQYLATLQRKLSDEARSIENKIDLVNEALRKAPFGRGTFLEIRSRPIHQQDVQAFRGQLKDALAQSFNAEAAASDPRFHKMKAIVERLGSTKAEDERWRATVLDVRQHVEFLARETNDEGAEVETYAGGGGKSGGQRQKLTTTCLAAALHFQLVAESEEYPRFAPVAMDEAFDKADHEFTTIALGIFRSFGFQMIVATPMKAVTTFEPFIGGATMVSIRDKRYSTPLPLTVQQLMTAARAGPDAAA